jgi:tetratricopeptide (TPR) repeat protein
VGFLQEANAINYFADGMESFELGEFAEALPAFEKAVELAPGNLEYRYYLGLVNARLERNEQALEIFRSILEREPLKYLKVYFDIAAVHSKMGEHEKAIEVLDRAAEADPNNARAYIEKAYAYRHLGRYEQAIENLNKAKEVQPEFTQNVYYDLGALFFEMEKFDLSIEMFQKAVEVNPGNQIAENAEKSIPHVKAAKRNRKPWYLSGSFSWGYDDNVPLDPLETVGPRIGDVRDAGDQFQVFLARGGYKFINRKDLELGAGYSLTSVGYEKFLENNVLAHIPHLYLQLNKEPVYLRLLYEFSYYYSGGRENGQDKGLYLTFGDDAESKLRAHSVTPTIAILEPFNLRSDITFFYQNKEYLDEITSDAVLYSAAFVQSYSGKRITPRVGYKYGYEDAVNEESSYRIHEFMAGLSAPIYWGIMGDIALSYLKTDYQDFPVEGDREDSHYMIALTFARTFMDRLQVQLYYNYSHNDSNVLFGTGDPFRFEKNIWLFTINYTF